MKTMFYITVPAALAVLLSACAAPQPVQQQLDEMNASLEKLQPSVDVLQSRVEKLEGMTGRPEDSPTITFAALIENLIKAEEQREDSNGCGKDGAVGIATQITYRFANMGSVSATERKNREKFYNDLNSWLGKQKLGSLSENDQSESYEFVLTKLDLEDDVNDKIAMLATQVPDAEVPVRLDCDDANLAFRKLTRTYNSVSGVAEGAPPKIAETCTRSFTFAFAGEAIRNARVWVYQEDLGLVEGRSHTITSQPYPCVDDPPIPSPAYLMAVLDKPPVAQYRILDIGAGTESQIPLKTITVGKPACPPRSIDPRAATKFQAELDGLGGCQRAD